MSREKRPDTVYVVTPFETFFMDPPSTRGDSEVFIDPEDAAIYAMAPFDPVKDKKYSKMTIVSKKEKGKEPDLAPNPQVIAEKLRDGLPVTVGFHIPSSTLSARYNYICPKRLR